MTGHATHRERMRENERENNKERLRIKREKERERERQRQREDTYADQKRGKESMTQPTVTVVTQL